VIATPPQPTFTDFEAENRYYEAENAAIRDACRELEDENGDLIADLDEEGLAAQADVAWIDEQFNQGLMAPYYGHWVAVVNKVLLGHDKSLKALRERVIRETGYSIDRIVTSHVDRFDR
jgi:hypothetical protein